MDLMHSHLDSVANRALVAPAPQRGRDLLDILAPYADEGDERPRGEDAEGRAGQVSVYASIPRCTRMRSALSFQTSIFTIWPPLTTKRST